MAIFLRHSYNVPPPRWGSVADVQYAIKVNSEKIYGLNCDNYVLRVPLFWGFPLIDYSKKNNILTNDGATYKNNSLVLDGINDFVAGGSNVLFDTTKPLTISWTQFLTTDYSGSDQYPVPLVIKTSQTTGFIIFWSIGLTYQGLNFGSSANFLRRKTIINISGKYLNRWANINIVFDGVSKIASTSYRLYIDGINQGLMNAGGFAAISNINNIGTHGATNYFNGAINDIGISDVRYTENQVTLFNDIPYGLYQKVARPFYVLPIVDVTTTTPTTSPVTTVASTTLAPATTPVPTTPIYTTIPPTTEFVATTPLPITTLAPTTPQPTTFAPTTLWQTTLGPTTLAPTTLKPTTLVPTTVLPTTVAATTLLPTTVAPTSLAPTTLAPTTIAPTSLAPTTITPTTLVLTTIASTTLAPTTLVSTTLQPTTVAPTTAYPTTLIPTTVGPTTLPPTTLLPTTNIPEVICIKNFKSIITNEFITKSHITKELRIHGNLC